MGEAQVPIDTFNPLDTENFVNESFRAVRFIANYYQNVEKYPVRSQVEQGYLRKLSPSEPPYFPEPLETILEETESKILTGLSHWQSPNFYSYFPANTSTAAFLGEMLCMDLNIVGFNWMSSPAATELEAIVMDSMGKMLKLPQPRKY